MSNGQWGHRHDTSFGTMTGERGHSHESSLLPVRIYKGIQDFTSVVAERLGGGCLLVEEGGGIWGGLEVCQLGLGVGSWVVNVSEQEAVAGGGDLLVGVFWGVTPMGPYPFPTRFNPN